METALVKLRRYLPRAGSVTAYAVALAIMTIAIALRAAATFPLPPYLTVYPALVLASFACGIRAGALAAVVGGAISTRMFLPDAAFTPTLQGFVTTSAFIAAAAITVASAGLARNLLDEVSALEGERTKAARETVHRIKNLTAVIQALSQKIAGQTEDRDTYLKQFHQRLGAIASAQDMLVRTEWRDADLGETIGGALAPFVPSPRFVIAPGPTTDVPAALVSGLSLALYELATNALKYGGLTREGGDVKLSWDLDQGRCVLTWAETGGDAKTGREGMGGFLIRTAMDNLRGARVDYALSATGVRCVFSWPLASATR
jgi:two-component sensor histidine kinase